VTDTVTVSDDLAELSGKSLLIFDDGLATADGHWIEYNKAVAVLNARLGIRTTVICDRGFPHAAELEAMGVTVLPLVERSPWRELVAGVSPFGPLKTLRYGWHFSRVLARVLRGQAFDCVLHPAAMGAHLLAWCLLPRRLRRRAVRAVFTTWITLASYRGDGQPRFARRLAYWKPLGAWLRREFASGRFAFGTDSERLAHEYRLLAGLPAREMPSPTTAAAPVPSERDPTAPVCFGSVGPARLEKGIDVFEAAIAALPAGADSPPMRFLIQWNRPVLDPAGVEVKPGASLLADPRIRLITHAMSSDEYRALVAEIDCMVMPYRRSAYYTRGSGVAVEAACGGIPMIVTADTWLENFVEQQGAGLAVPDGDAAALAGAMVDVARDFPAIRARAVERAGIALRINSAEAFARALWRPLA